MILGWKLAAQVATAGAAVTLTAVSMFGADSSSTARPVPTTRPAAVRSTTTTTTLPAVDVAGADATNTDSSGGGSGGGGSGGDSFGGSTGDGTSASAVPETTDTGPSPTVAESSVPVALPVTGAVTVALVTGIVIARRRRRTGSVSR